MTCMCDDSFLKYQLRLVLAGGISLNCALVFLVFYNEAFCNPNSNKYYGSGSGCYECVKNVFKQSGYLRIFKVYYE